MHRRFVSRIVFVIVCALALNIISLTTPKQVAAATLSNSALKWTTQLSAGSGAWQSVVWSPEQGKFVALASNSTFPFGVTSRIMTSTNATNWTLSTSPPSRPLYTSLAWSSSLNIYAAVSCADTVGSTCLTSTTSSGVATSTDGATWTVRTNPDATASWRSITWAPGIGFVAVADSGTNRVMTSPDGVTWTARTASEANAWRAIAWSPELNLFVAVAASGTNRVMTSPDGVTWTNQTAAEANSWDDVTWSPDLDLFVAVSQDGTNRIMTSPNGVTWTPRVAPGTNAWSSVAWSPQLSMFVAIANGGTNRVMTSPDGVTWTATSASVDNAWNSVTWAPALESFVAVSSTGAAANPIGQGTYRVMTGSMASAGTDTATNVAARSATLHGNYTDRYAGADVFFRYRVAGSNDAFTDTTPQAVTNEGAFAANASGLSPDTNYEYKAVVQWSSAAGTQTLEGGLQTFTTLLADDDNDGIYNIVEDAAPNNGDANDDGTPDSTQPYVASFVNSLTGKYATIELDTTCQIETASIEAESANDVADLLFDYPTGLMSFSTDCGTAGFTTIVKQYFFGVTDTSLVARKYNPTTKAYTTINASKDYPTIGSMAATRVTFSVTDGGELDTDGSANGTIVDPAGLGAVITNSSSPTDTSTGLANTGQNALLYGLAVIGLIASATVLTAKRSGAQVARKYI